MRVFLSYSRRDTAIADRLVADLEARDIAVDIDRRDLPYGEEWQAELARFVHRADTIVWLASDASVTSRWCKWELGEAQRLNKRLLPVRVTPLAPDQLPEALGRVHILPAEGVYDPAQHLDDLVRAIETDRVWMETHTRLGDRAAEWMARNRSPDRLLRGRALRDAESWRDSRPERAPPPGTATLDLILQSRRAATQGLRRLLGVAVAIAIAMIGLSIFAGLQWRDAREQETVALAEARAATLARDEAQAAQRAAELESARTATALAVALPDKGLSDGALLMLLDAQRTYADRQATPPLALDVAFHRALEQTSGRSVLSLPPNGTAFEGGAALYYYAPTTSELWSYDGSALTLIHTGAPGDADIIAVDDASDAVIAVRADLSVQRFTASADGWRAAALAFAPDPQFDPELANVLVHEDGHVLLRQPFNGSRVQLLNTRTGALYSSDLPDYEGVASYFVDPAGAPYLVMGRRQPYQEGDAFPLTETGGIITAGPAIGNASALVDQAYFEDCFRRAHSTPGAYNPAVTARMFDLDYPPRCLNGLGAILYAQDSFGTQGPAREDLVIFEGADPEAEPDYLASYLAVPATTNLSWVGVDGTDPDRVGIIADRRAIVSGGDADITRIEPERPSAAKFFGERLALIEARLGRLVIHDAPRARIRDSLVRRGGLFVPLRKSVCDLDETITAPTGWTLTMRSAGEAESRAIFTAADGRETDLGPIDRCMQPSLDWTRLVIVASTGLAVFDLDALASGATADAAGIAFIPSRSFLTAQFTGADNDLLTTSFTSSVLRWRLGADGIYAASVEYEGGLPINYAEYDRDERALIVSEDHGSGVFRTYIYVPSAHSVWMDLGSGYRGVQVAFGEKDTLSVADGFTSPVTVRIPTADQLAEEALAALAPDCRPATDGDYRASACWPEWL